MALVKCYECSKEISDTAKACPHCGANKKKKEKYSRWNSAGRFWYEKENKFVISSLLVILIVSSYYFYLVTVFDPYFLKDDIVVRYVLYFISILICALSVDLLISKLDVRSSIKRKLYSFFIIIGIGIVGYYHIFTSQFEISFAFTETECISGDCENTGTLLYKNGDIYEGELNSNGQKHGKGTFIYTPIWQETIDFFRNKYVGEWKDDKYHGQGTQTFGSVDWFGDKYVGEFKDGKKHGQGTYTRANGDKYVGEYKEDKMHGQGTYTFSNGNYDKVLFENGKFISAKCFDKYGNEIKCE